MKYPTHDPLDYGSDEYFWKNSDSLRCPICGQVFNAIYTTYSIDDQLKSYTGFYGGMTQHMKDAGIKKARKRLCWGYLPNVDGYYFIHFKIPVWKGGNDFTTSHHCLRLKLWDSSKFNTPHLLIHGWDTISKRIKNEWQN